MAIAREIAHVAPAKRTEHIRYAIRDIATLGDKLAREGKRVIPLNIGDPLAFDFETPPHLIEAVAHAMHDGRNGYAPSLGTGEALEAIRASAEREGIRGIQTAFVTYGVSEGADLCLTGLVNPGESVLVPCPEYPLYSAILTKLGVESSYYRLDESLDWAPDVDSIDAAVTERTRAIVVINPNNPTGAVYSRKALEGVADIARRHRLVIFADEIYDHLILDGEPHVTLAALAPDLPVVTFKGLSKVYLAPGWRVGWAVVSGPEEALRDYVAALHQLIRARLSGNNPMQYAIRPALEGPQDHLAGVIRRLKSRRDVTVEWARATPRISCVPPRAAFYAFPKVDVPVSDEEFVRRLLAEKLVMVVHGSGFGAYAAGHFRIVTLADEATLQRAYQAIAEFLREHFS